MGSDRYPCWYPVQIRFRDLDPLAHVNNTVYFIYYEEARSHYFNQVEALIEQWPSEEEHQDEEKDESPNPRIQTGPRGHHYGTLVKEVTCTYDLPLVRTDRVEVGVRTTRIGRTSIIMEHVICAQDDHSKIFARGRSVIVWCNYHTGRPAPVPLSLRHGIEQVEGQSFPQPEEQRA